MKPILKSITLTDFKGIVGTVTYDMHEQTRISGQNGAGKSTIADAFYWNLADKDYGLTNNPDIRPNDGRECVPTVTLEFNFDGKPVTVTKMQKMKKSKPDENGVVKTSLTNSYEVNSVPKSERDFKAYLEDLGVDFNLFLSLSHPDMFLKNMNEKKQMEAIRKILFGMADTSMSDLDIANSDSCMKDLAELLVNYNLEEVKAMQNATKRKIAENYGKDGDILRARIEGMESSKSHIDRVELEAQKKELQEVIADIESRIESTDKQYEAYKKLSDGVLELKFKLSDMERKANEGNINKRRELQQQIDVLTVAKANAEKAYSYNKDEIARLEKDIPIKEELTEKYRDEWRAAESREFDETKAICPYCGQELPEDKKEPLRTEFEQKKKAEKDDIAEKGNRTKEIAESEKRDLERLKTANAEYEKKIPEMTAQLQDLQRQYDEIPQSVDISDTEEYQNLKKEIADKEKAMAAESDTDTARDNLKAEFSAKRDELTRITNDIALADKDTEIDKKIEEKRKEGMKYEQEKADCERILYQVDLLNQKKNSLLEESINQHFKIVRWRLFDFQKNGAYLDDCTPLIDGKDFSSQTNGALKILAKLDIIAGLQKFYGQYYPVFVDDFSLVTGNTADRISMDCQLIELVAKEGVKELEFEEIA